MTTDSLECSMNRPGFFRKAYHNMRNPLVVIKGYTSLMLEGCGGDLTDDQREWITDMKINTDYLLQLINNLAELSFIEAGIGEQERTSLDLSLILDSLVQKHRGMIEDKKIKIEVTKPENRVFFSADKQLAIRAFGNLFHNAITYTPGGGSVKLSLQEKGDNILFSVENSGTGLETEQLEQVLEGFFQGENASGVEYKGTGLGLLMARRIAGLYGGDLQVESTPGSGSRLILSFKR